MEKPFELAYTELKKGCFPEELSFRTTAEIKPLEGVIGQERAVKAFDFGLAVKMTVQTYAVVRGILGFIFTLLIIATAYCYHDWVQVAFLFSLSVILYLILFAGVFVDTVLDMTRERIIDFIIS